MSRTKFNVASEFQRRNDVKRCRIDVVIVVVVAVVVVAVVVVAVVVVAVIVVRCCSASHDGSSRLTTRLTAMRRKQNQNFCSEDFLLRIAYVDSQKPGLLSKSPKRSQTLGP